VRWTVCTLLLLVAAQARGDDPPTFHQEVLPILQRRCQVCHRDGGVGPFSLERYEDAADMASMVAEVVENRRMPPWHADPKVGAWENSRRLSDGERDTLLAWARGGAPAGDPAQAPAPRSWPKEWALGEPDAVLEAAAADVPATGVVEYRYSKIRSDFGEDKWVTGYEIQVGAPEVVHHVLVFLEFPDGSQRKVKGGLKGYFASALPGDMVSMLPAGTGKRVPRGTTFVFQLHYSPNGTAARDQTRLGLHFGEPEAIEREAKTVALFNTELRVPPGAKNYVVRARYRFKEDVYLYGLTPHLHLRGKSFYYLLLGPDGSSREVLSIPAYDFNWQTTYRLEQPLLVRKGSKMLGIAHYDNSAENPANPDPSAVVRFGEQTWDEMMIGYMDVYPTRKRGGGK